MTLTQTEKNRRTTIVALIVVLVALALWGLSGCSSLWSSVKSSSAPAGGAAGGAALGSFAPPLGPIIGAAIGAVITHAMFENAALRSGETIGEGALDAELRRWRSKTPKEWMETADSAYNWKWRIIWIGIGAFLIWFSWRNRHNWAKYGYWHGVWIHGIFGGKFGTHKHA